MKLTILVISLLLSVSLLGAQSFLVSPIKQQGINCDYLIITVDSLLPGAEKLALYRASNEKDGIKNPKIILMTDIRKEFGNNTLTPDHMLWNSLHYVYTTWSSPFKYLVLAGDDSLHFNQTDSLFYSCGKIPARVGTYRNRPHRSDELSLRCMKNVPHVASMTDDWYYSINQDTMPKSNDSLYSTPIIIGRIPCENALQLHNYIAKMVTYESTLARNVHYNKTLFLSDDGFEGSSNDYISHHGSVEKVSLVLAKGTFINKFHLAEYLPDGANSNEQDYARAHDSLLVRIEGGVGEFIFFGHGSPSALTEETVFSVKDAERLATLEKPIHFRLFTCSGAPIFVPFSQSTAKQLLFSKKGGAMSVMGSNTIEHANTNEDFAKAFFTVGATNKANSFGEQMVLAKKTTYTFLTNYMFLGDPAIPYVNSTHQVNFTFPGASNMEISATIPDIGSAKMAYRMELACIDSTRVSENQNGWWFSKRTVIKTIQDSLAGAITITVPEWARGKKIMISLFGANDNMCFRNDTVFVAGISSPIVTTQHNNFKKTMVMVTANALKISTGVPLDYISSVAIFTARGQKVFSTSINNKVTDCTLSHKAMNLPTGFYLVRATTSRSVMSERILITK